MVFAGYVWPVFAYRVCIFSSYIIKINSYGNKSHQYQYQFIREQVQTNNIHQIAHHMVKFWKENKPLFSFILITPFILFPGHRK